MNRPLWRYVVIGLVGGFLSGFAGIGGGVVLIPMMVGLLGVSQHQAHGTSLAIIIPTAIVAATQYFFTPPGAAEGAGAPIPMDLAVAYMVTAVVGAPIGAWLIHYVNPKHLRQLFGLLLLALSVGSLTRGQEPGLVRFGNIFLATGLIVLVAGTLIIAAREHRRSGQAAAASTGAAQ